MTCVQVLCFPQSYVAEMTPFNKCSGMIDKAEGDWDHFSIADNVW